MIWRRVVRWLGYAPESEIFALKAEAVCLKSDLLQARKDIEFWEHINETWGVIFSASNTLQTHTSDLLAKSQGAREVVEPAFDVAAGHVENLARWVALYGGHRFACDRSGGACTCGFDVIAGWLDNYAAHMPPETVPTNYRANVIIRSGV